ncbi:MAG: CopD family protein [Sulfuricellaceae bacterium]
MVNLLLLLHLLGVIVWVGGMFFAHMALRPAVAELLQPAQRLALLNGVFGRFFFWVWLSVILIAASGGLIMMLLGGFKAAWYIHVMLAGGTVMAAIFAFIFFFPYSRLKQNVARQDWPAAGIAMARIRTLVGVNLILGLLTTCVAFGGRLSGGS